MSKTQHPLYSTYANMVNRCYNENATGYNNYGGRGITVCQRWLDDFWTFVADMGDRPDGLTLDRKNVDGNYEPDNCRWTDWSTQCRNRRPKERWNTLPAKPKGQRRRNGTYLTHNGVERSVTDWARESGLSANLIRSRINAGWNVTLALTTAPQR